MRIPIIRGVIERRILVNFRVDPAVVARILPAPFRPRLVGGCSLAGVCLIRLGELRPWFWPRALGISSENAAHRIAVEWEQQGRLHEGVFVPRRDTSSWFNTLAGGRLFPGFHHHASIQSQETADDYRVRLDSDDRQVHLDVRAHAASDWPAGSVFPTLQAASDFFRQGSLGYSAAAQPGTFAGLELRCRNWSMLPLAMEAVESSFFAARSLFPQGSVEFDSALLMRRIEHEWQAHESLCNCIASRSEIAAAA